MGADTSSSSSAEDADAYGSEDDFEQDDDEEDAPGDDTQPVGRGSRPTVDVTLGHMDDDEARDSVRGQSSSKSLPSPISPIKRARENAYARDRGAGRRPM